MPIRKVEFPASKANQEVNREVKAEAPGRAITDRQKTLFLTVNAVATSAGVKGISLLTAPTQAKRLTRLNQVKGRMIMIRNKPLPLASL